MKKIKVQGSFCTWRRNAGANCIWSRGTIANSHSVKKTAPFQRTLFVFFSGPEQEEDKPPRAPRCFSITIVTVLRVLSFSGRSHGILWLYKKPETGHARERNENNRGERTKEKQRRHTQRTRRQKERTEESTKQKQKERGNEKTEAEKQGKAHRQRAFHTKTNNTGETHRRKLKRKQGGFSRRTKTQRQNPGGTSVLDQEEEQRNRGNQKKNRRSKRRRQWSNTQGQRKKKKKKTQKKDRDTNRGPTTHQCIRLRLQVSLFFSSLHYNPRYCSSEL